MCETTLSVLLHVEFLQIICVSYIVYTPDCINQERAVSMP